MQKQERSNGCTLLSDIVIHDSEASVNSETDNIDKDNTENLYVLPTLLANYRGRLLIYAGLIGVVSIFFAVFFRYYGPLVLLFGSAYLCCKASRVEADFCAGTIVEAGAVCTGISVSRLKDRVHVSFRTTDEEKPAYFKFAVPQRSSQDDFIIDAPYVIYFDITNPHVLIGFVPV